MKHLVDIYGNPLTYTPDDELQTDEARLGHLLHHFAEHPSSGLTPPKLAAILQEAEQGSLIAQCELAEDIEEKDGHIFSELQKRRRALQSLDWEIKPPRTPSKAELADVALLQELVEDMTDLDEIILDMGDAILKGFSCQELEWHIEEGLHLPRCHFRDPGWFQVHPQRRNELRLRDNSYEGAALRPFGWLAHSHQAKSGYLGRSALVRVLAWPFLFKNYSVRDLAEFLEIYGLPLRIGQYPAGASEKEKATLLKAVMSIGHNAGGIIPKGMQIDFQEAAKGAAGPFEAMIAWCERTQSKAILGGTLTSQADGKTSTNALGNVHNEVRQELRDSDAKQIAATLTRDLIYPLYALNGKSFSGPRRIPRFEFDLTEPEDIAHYSQHLPNLVDLGVPVPVSWVQDKLQIPQPADDEPVLSRQSTQLPAGLKANVAALKADPAEPIDRLIAQAQLQAADPASQMVKQIRTVVENADNLEELRSQLMALPLDDSQLTQALAEAMNIASLAGRYDILQEAL